MIFPRQAAGVALHLDYANARARPELYGAQLEEQLT